MKRVNRKAIIVIVSGIVLLTEVASCNFFGAFDNPVDPQAENYQGFLSIQIQDLAIGYAHVLALSDEGDVYAWGMDWNGRLGDGGDYTDDYIPPEKITSLSGIAEVSGSDNFSLARGSDGSLWGWGASHDYQLGTDIDGNVLDDDCISPLLLADDAAMVEAGGRYTVMVDENGDLYIWGFICSGSVDNVLFESAEPVQLATPVAITKVACGSETFIVLADDHTVWRYGWWDDAWHEDFEQITGLTDIEDIAASSDRFIAEGAGGTLWTWGNYGEYPLWDSTDTPVQVPVSASGFSSITAGEYCGLALAEDGKFYGWGSNRHGQLGLPLWQFAFPEPVRIDNAHPGHDFAGGRVYSGSGATFAWAPDGELLAWGKNDDGLLGLGKRGAPDMDLDEFTVDFGTVVEIVAADGGRYFGTAADSNGDLWTWGYNGEGQLGRGDTEFRQNPEKVSTLSEVVAVSAGGAYVIARDSGGSLWSWGDNSHGQLGQGDNTTRMSPVEIIGFGSSPIAECVCGYQFALALDEDGALWSWGDNYHGELGLGTTLACTSPDEITSFDAPITDFACGQHHSLALDENGSLWAWGNNESGQLGNGSTTDSLVPVKIDSSHFNNLAITSIEAGSSFSIAVTEDGGLWGWGHDYSVGIGPGGTVYSTPVRITPFEDVQSLASRDSGYFFTTGDGSFYYSGLGSRDSCMVYGPEETFTGSEGQVLLIYGSDLWSHRNLRSIEGGCDHFFLIDENGVLYAF